MPLEIRELVIRTTVAGGDSRPSDSGSLSEASQSAIIAACIEQVLAILQARRER